MGGVIGIGAALFDVLMTVDTYPAEDTKLRGNETKFQCGGPCATALVAVSKLGGQAAYWGTVGDEMFGSFVRAELERYGVNTAGVRTVSGRNAHSVVLLNTASGSRTCVWNRGDARPPRAENLDIEALRQADFLHVDGNHLDCAVYAAKKAREFGIPVSMDAGGVYPDIQRLLPLVDVLIPSEEFAKKVTGQETAAGAARGLQDSYHPKTLIVTQGSRGGFLWENGQERRYPVFPVKTVDSNGAGDTFHGAFLAARMRGLDVFAACTFASAASALKCTRFGAQQGIPGWQEVLDFQKENRAVIADE